MVTHVTPNPHPGSESAETDLHRYARLTADSARQTSTAVRIIAWIICIAAAGTVILGIIVAVQVSQLNSSLNGNSGNSGGSSQNTCASQGGTLPC